MIHSCKFISYIIEFIVFKARPRGPDSSSFGFDWFCITGRPPGPSQNKFVALKLSQDSKPEQTAAESKARVLHCHWGGGESHLGPCSPDPLESVLFCDNGEVFSPVRVGSCGIKPSFIRFFCFIRRFWNQIWTDRGVMSSILARLWRWSKLGSGSSSKVFTKTASCSRVILHLLGLFSSHWSASSGCSGTVSVELEE